ncbi:MAG TPA: phosphoglucosamine mutase [Myxococcota bacterium]|nr:phosphoglucosamine mutase [Myxococcota bacterium]
MTERTLFGTDGVRGVANRHPMTVEIAMGLGRAVALMGARKGHRAKVLIGKDTRLSGYMFETALAAGVCSMGADVLLCGPLPTPGVAYLTSGMRADAGIVISASHTPYQDNGIKIFGPDAFKLPDEQEARIERVVLNAEDAGVTTTSSPRIGKAFRIDDAVGRYVTFLKGLFPRELTLEGMKIVIDCANGAGYKVGPAVLAELGATVVELFTRPDGRNINKSCGALNPEAMCHAVRKHGATLGIALDGDADRVIFSDERGYVVDGDAVMAILATDMLASGELRRRALVTTVMSNLALDRVIEDAGGKVVRSKVGDRYVVEKMRGGGYNFGGEQSGHLVFLAHSTTGDGIIGALKILATVLRRQKPLSELASALQPYPQALVNVPVKQKTALKDLPEVTAVIQDVERKLRRDGRVLVRYSGTEPKARVLVEGPEPLAVRQYADEIAEALRRAVG